MVTDEEPIRPSKVNASELRDHFKKNYNLVDDQIDLMIQVSSMSLNESLKGLYNVLDKGGNLGELAKLGHNIKGVLLNMGEREWADFAREIELSAAAGKKVDYRSMVKHIHKGLEDVL